MTAETEESSLFVPLPSSRVGFHYVLILEWLEDDEPRTGADLHAYLQAIGVPSTLVVCRTAEDTRSALDNALHNVSTYGKPVIHIEAHGVDPYAAPISETNFGTQVTTGMTWYELGDWLAPLNEACGFELLVVGATCFGFGAIAAMKVNAHGAPFAACAGFTTPVNPGSVRDVMKELYRSIKNGVPLQESVASAALEVRSDGETFQVTSSIKLALHVLRGVYDSIRTPQSMSVRVASIISQAQEFGFVIHQDMASAMPAQLRERSRVRMEEAWNCWFPASLQASVPAYRLDWSLVEKWWS